MSGSILIGLMNNAALLLALGLLLVSLVIITRLKDPLYKA
jgi:hypothetical protein